MEVDDFNYTPKPPPITEEERRLIDEAVAAGRITVIPEGTVSIDYTRLDPRKDIVNKMYKIRTRMLKFRRAAKKRKA